MVQALLHVREEQAANTDGGSSSAGVQTRVLNTVVTNDISGASLSSNQITLDAATYEIEAYAPTYRSNLHRAYLYNTTDAGDEVIGAGNYSRDSTQSGGNRSQVRGRFTLAGTKTLELRHDIQTAFATIGLGRPINDTRIEIYSDVMIREIVSDFDLMHVQDQKTANTDGGSSSAGINVRTLNTVATNEISGASLASDTITLLAGTYQIEAGAPCQEGNVHKIALRNKTDAGTPLIALGLPVFTDEGQLFHDRCYLFQQFIIDDTKDFELIHQIGTAQATNGLGRKMNDGRIEIFADVIIRKLI